MGETVYVVERCYDCEGCSVQRVFSTRRAADCYAEKENRSFGYEEDRGPHVVTEWPVLKHAVDPMPAPSSRADKGEP